MGSIFPSSINLFVSINVVAIVIVGGMGSIPGVVVGAIVLIGLPELFREFSEYRFLFYGLALMRHDALPAGGPAGRSRDRPAASMHGAEAARRAAAVPADATRRLA